MGKTLLVLWPSGTWERTPDRVPEMHVRLERGPLDSRTLQQVSLLYGRFNPKYRDVTFCEHLFSAGPQGPAYHALLEVGEQVVGHYAIIPLLATVDGRHVRGGKGEAFVIHDDHRTGTVEMASGRSIQAGVALPLLLYEFTLNDGLQVVHMLADRDVGMIHRLAGCRPVQKRAARGKLTLDRGAPTKALHRLGGSGQRFYTSLATSMVGRGDFVARPVDTLARSDRARIVEDLQVRTGWSLLIDADTLDWMAGSGMLWLHSRSDRMDDYAIACERAAQGRTTELVFFRLRSRALRSAAQLLASVIDRARQAGAAEVLCSDAAAAGTSDQIDLARARNYLGLASRDQAITLLIRSPHARYFDPQQLHYTPLFHAIF